MDPSASDTREFFCRGLKSDSQLCDCEEFFPRTEDEGHCVECGHGRSKHPRKARASGCTPAEDQRDANEQPHRSSSIAVKDIFARITGGKTVNDNSKSSVTGKRGSLPLTTAREEALSTMSSTRLAGYHKLAKGPVPLAAVQKVRES